MCAGTGSQRGSGRTTRRMRQGGGRRPRAPAGFLRALGLCAMLGAGVVASAGSGPPDADAIPIYQPHVGSPLETAGTGIAPVLEIEISVDSMGKVAGIDVKKIQPSSEFDDAFRQAAVEGLSRWRFLPARRDGQDVASTLPITFHIPAHGNWESKGGDSRSFLLTQLGRSTLPSSRPAAEMRRKILALPAEQRRRMLERVR